MARLKSPEKREAILQAAVQEIAQAGLGAPTARIAARAGVAEGTLFTYFPNKEELLNELYLALKGDVYERVNASFPHKGDLRRRASHVWSTYLRWAIEFPEKRRASVQLNVSDVISPETRTRSALGRENIDKTMAELGRRNAVRKLPSGFAAATMMALQEATMDFVARQPKQREALIEDAFDAFWRVFR
ncbi:MAG TPA: TetR/AcrR family transcriptional regulator [Edaphobacter sp.]|nr:TetR/AcrR family transcriptional regulator [Edaphobacter sp.]